MTTTAKSSFRSFSLLLIPALAASLLFSSCSNDPKATDPDNTATVVENPDVEPVTADTTSTEAPAQ
ncbi:hypothetical protein GCM10023185_42210 [Hymenobacter saemangeumensis]|uniref:Uncharacterized protein n=1 Tax=Hymenobacter saemangeumensis TaxID=1084522 RepID=A0ABP8ISE7_9BACT